MASSSGIPRGINQEWRKRPRLEGYGKHTMKWEEFHAANAQNAGHEIYRFIAEACVLNPETSAQSAGILRRCNKDFRNAIDALIPQYMVTFNENLAQWRRRVLAVKQLEDTSTRDMTAEEKAAHTTSHTSAKIIEAVCQRFVELKFGWHVAMSLRKLVTTSINGTIDTPPEVAGSHERSEAKLHMSTGLTTFLSMAAPKGSCEIHSRCEPLRSFKRSVCTCPASLQMGGEFCIIPNSQLLVMHAGQQCVHESRIVFNPSNGRPINPLSAARAAAWSENMCKRTIEFAEVLMANRGIAHPFGRERIREAVGSAEWMIHVENPHRALMIPNRIARQRASGSLQFMLLDHPAFQNTNASIKVPTVQRLLRCSTDDINDAHEQMCSADDLEREIAHQRIKIVEDHCLRQFNDQLVRYGSQEGLDNMYLDAADSLLPGLKNLVQKSVFEPIASLPADRTREANINAFPFTKMIMKAAVLGMGTLRRIDLQIAAAHASPYAYAFVTGLCVGHDPSFQKENMCAALMHDPDCSLLMHKNYVTTMHVFDGIDYTSVKVIPCPQEEIASFARDYNGGNVADNIACVLKWSFTMAGQRLTGPIFASKIASWYDNKANAGYVRLASLGYTPQLVEVPSKRCHLALAAASAGRGPPPPGGPTATEACKSFCHWFQYTAQHFMARPETRAIGLDILTGDRGRTMMVQVVGELGLDTELIASAAVAMQIEEAEEDAGDA